jgi:hypothetical protein
MVTRLPQSSQCIAGSGDRNRDETGSQTVELVLTERLLDE